MNNYRTPISGDSAVRNPLVVTDLDGTLFTAEKRVSERSARIINSFIRGGGQFTIATARMPFGARAGLDALTLPLPAVVMNGAGIYSFAEGRFTHAYPIADAAVSALRSIVAHADVDAFVYTLRDGVLHLAYTSDATLRFSQYNSVAAQIALPPFTKLDSSDWSQAGDVVYAALVGAPSALQDAADTVRAVAGVQVIEYENVYTRTTCVEIASSEAGKGNATAHLAASVGASDLLVFGDNDNDLEMMRLADISFAPSNAAPAARALADHVIEANDDDGVALEIGRRFGLATGMGGEHHSGWHDG